MARSSENRWHSRPFAASVVRVVVVLAPLLAAGATSLLVAHAVDGATAVDSLALRWVVVVASSVGVLVIVHRLSRQLLPLAVLLRLSLAFPGAAPSRFAVARAATNLRELEERLRIARTTGFDFDEDAGQAAEIILSLVAAVEAHERSTRGHAARVRVYTDLIADQLNIHPEDRDRLRWAALVHDVGKLEVPTSVLNKAGPLDPRELEIVKRHPEDGARLTKPLHAWLGEWADSISEHHERFDGRGYPRGATGGEISLGARIIAVADVYETMTAARPYHRPKSQAEARRELVRCSGTQFDPTIVGVFLQVPERRLQAARGGLGRASNTPVLRELDRLAGVVGRVISAAIVTGGILAVSIAGVTLHR